MFKILQKFLPEIINLLLTFYLQAQHFIRGILRKHLVVF